MNAVAASSASHTGRHPLGRSPTFRNHAADYTQKVGLFTVEIVRGVVGQDLRIPRRDEVEHQVERTGPDPALRLVSLVLRVDNLTTHGAKSGRVERCKQVGPSRGRPVCEAEDEVAVLLENSSRFAEDASEQLGVVGTLIVVADRRIHDSVARCMSDV